MAQYIHFTPESKNLTAPSGGTSGVCGFVTRQEVIASTVSADTMADWISLNTQHLPQNSFIYTVSPNLTGVERTAVISIAAKVQLEGEAYLITDYDITTIRQAAQNQSGGSILPNYTSFTPRAEGDSGTCTFTTANVVKSSIGIYCDQPYVTMNYLTDEQGYKNGFEWSVGENSELSSRQFTFTISAKRSNSDGYAYAYVSGVQPSVNNVGYISFEYDTVRASASTMSSSINFETEFVSRQPIVVSNQYWLHNTFIDVQSGQTEGRYDGYLEFTIDENPYNYGRTGTMTVYGTSDIDGSIVQTTLHFYQAANEYGGTQTGFIYCQNPVIIMETPEAISNPSICQFHLSYDNMTLSSVTIRDFEGNFAGAPTFPAGDKAALTFALNNATSTTEYTISTIQVYGKDTSGRTIPPIIVNVMQPPFIEYVEFPIWRDTDIVIPTDMDYLLYRLTVNNEIVYNGRAFALNGNVTIRMNEIMQQLLLPTIDLTSEGIQDNNAYANALLYISLDGIEYQKYKEVKSYADWSYKNEQNSILSNPIKKEVDRRQMFLCTAADYAGNGPTIIVTSFDESGNVVDNVYSLINNIGTVVQTIGSANEINVLVGETETQYTVIDGCERYCLYYLNCRGGYDSFIFNKTSKEKDSFERLTFKRNINNNYPTHQVVEYRTKVKKEWTLNTGLLTDKQSINFAENVVGTPMAFLHDLEENRIYPVSIKTNTVDYQTFVRNGRKFCKYSLNVELAQNRYRS